MTFRSNATLATALIRILENDPATVGVYDRRSRLFHSRSTHTELALAAAQAQRLLAAGVSAGQPVLVVAGPPALLWRGYLAGVLAGALPVLMPIRPVFDSAAEVTRKLDMARRALPDAQLLIHTTDGRPCVGAGAVPWMPMAETGDEADARDLLDRLRVGPDTPLHLQLTSGSTGDAKPVVVTHGNVMANLGAVVDRMGITPGSHLVSWLPLYHDFSLASGALSSLLSGGHLRLLSPFDFLADPMHWLIAIDQSPDAVSAAPNFALDQVVRRADADVLARLDLSDWRACYSGAEAIEGRTVSRFLDLLRGCGFRPEAFCPGYGLAEATIMVSLARCDETPMAVSVRTDDIGPRGPVDVLDAGDMVAVTAAAGSGTTTVASLGSVAPDVMVEIVDPETGLGCGPDSYGEVVVSGPSVSPGYRRPDGSIDTFPEGRCRTGDIGFIHEGQVHLVERTKNVIVRHGRTHSATAYEQALARWADIPFERCAVIQTDFVGGTVAAVVEKSRTTDTDRLLEAVRQLGQELDLPIDEVLLVERNAVPRTTSGKKQHLQLRAGLRSGEIPVVARLVPADRGEEASPHTIIDLDRLEAERVEAGPLPTDEDGVLAALVELIEAHARRRGWEGSRLAVGASNEVLLRGDLGLDSLALIELAVEAESLLGRPVSERAAGGVETVGDLIDLVSAPPLDGPGLTELLERLAVDLPQVYRRVEQQQGRQLLIDGRWITDFASVNYLGLDLAPELMAAIEPMVAAWGTHPSWTRAVASPMPYRDLEEGLAELIGAPEVMVFSTITLAHIGILPLLATSADTLIVDRSAHNSIQEGAELAAARGADLRWFEHRDLDGLASMLSSCRGRPVVAVDGVYSMTGTVPDLPAICDLVAERGGLVYVDDAHGIGVLGRGPTVDRPYGYGGGGVVTHFGLDYEHLVYVSGLSKAFSSMAAFVSCRDSEQRRLFERASTSIFSGPVPVASLATALAGLEVNRRDGEDRRRHLHALSVRVIEGARARGYAVDNDLAFPVVNLVTGDVSRTVAAARVMWDHGILFTPSVFPAAPLDRSGFRISLTSANSDDDVDRLLNALDAVELALGSPPAELAVGSMG